MNKIVILLVALLGVSLFTACETKKQQEATAATTPADSLKQIINQKDTELNDMVTTLNEIQEGFRQINEAQGRISVARANKTTAKRSSRTCSSFAAPSNSTTN